MAADMELIGAIHRLDQEIGDQKSQVKTTKEAYDSELKQSDEFKALEEAQNTLKVAKLGVERLVLTDPSLRKMQTNLEDEKLKLKDLKEIMSHHLVKYFEESGRQVIKLDDLNDDIVREVLISAKLGKETLDPETIRMPL